MNYGEPTGSPPQKRRRLSPPPPTNGNARPTELLPAPPPRLEPSFIGYDPFDDFTKEVADWIADLIRNQENVEIEAKIGLLLDQHSNLRLRLPVMSETILSPQIESLRFQSSMTENQHKSYNDMLNQRVERSAHSSPSLYIKYAHTRIIDEFYAVQSNEFKARMRVSRDEKTGQIVECVRKSRMGDMNVYCPKWGFDYRLSVNRELPNDPPPPQARPDMLRRKDRVSYSHQAYRIDLTQVFPHPAGKDNTVTHELEVEFLNPAVLVRECGKRDRGEPSAFDEMIQVFLNNVRILIRTAAPP
ncbi:mRNA triphosphatase CET1 [Calocera viscosa TUFC12733]|uniref:mRNA-capping enzyme subunit beta n=1 Tax=Calocera viscosa (strain TUFC12733) TaxID=1330018 RepID=A0A167MPB6_CALVF|nr:mRNA triphosphatase CET1 [Calocera viscosa TUFC12733]